jgi:hypothetical protein
LRESTYKVDRAIDVAPAVELCSLLVTVSDILHILHHLGTYHVGKKGVLVAFQSDGVRSKVSSLDAQSNGLRLIHWLESIYY